MPGLLPGRPALAGVPGRLTLVPGRLDGVADPIREPPGREVDGGVAGAEGAVGFDTEGVEGVAGLELPPGRVAGVDELEGDCGRSFF